MTTTSHEYRNFSTARSQVPPQRTIMSGLLMGHAFYFELPLRQKMLLLAIADHANDDGYGAHPSQVRLAQKASCTVRQIRRLVEALEEAGYIEIIERGNGRGLPTQYYLPWAALKADIQVSPLKAKHKGGHFGTKGGHSGQKADTQMSYEPSLEPSPQTVDNKSPSARNLNSSGDKMEIWLTFLAQLDRLRSEGILSPIDNPEPFAKKAARSGSTPPEDVDINTLMVTARAVQTGMGLKTVRLPGFDVMASTAHWFGRCRTVLADDFFAWLEWASAQVERKGSLADDKLLLHALTQAGTLAQFSEWEAERVPSAP